MCHKSELLSQSAQCSRATFLLTVAYITYAETTARERRKTSHNTRELIKLIIFCDDVASPFHRLNPTIFSAARFTHCAEQQASKWHIKAHFDSDLKRFYVLRRVRIELRYWIATRLTIRVVMTLGMKRIRFAKCSIVKLMNVRTNDNIECLGSDQKVLIEACYAKYQ